MMRVVITGSPTRAASFKIRGQQLGDAIGATVMPEALASVLDAADVIVAIKRIGPELAARLRASKRPVVWDALDFFEQKDPAPRPVLVGQARSAAERIGASVVIGATLQMADDLGSPFHLVHHGWDRGRAAVREKIRVVAYEGAEPYIADAREWIDRVCAAHGARFLVNPPEYLEADVVLAMRAGAYDTYATRNWKSGLKLANAQIAGIPFVGRRECGYLEQASGAELWIEDEWQFAEALELLADPVERARRAEVMFAAAPRLEAVASAYRRLLESVA